jgi:hypothetical protein
MTQIQVGQKVLGVTFLAGLHYAFWLESHVNMVMGEYTIRTFVVAFNSTCKDLPDWGKSLLHVANVSVSLQSAELFFATALLCN